MRLKYQQNQDEVANLVRYMADHVTALEEEVGFLKAENEKLQGENRRLQSENLDLRDRIDRLVGEITAMELRKTEAV